MVSDSPHIYSNGYHFKFLKEDSISTVGYVIPYWLNAVPSVVSKNKEVTTAILLPLKEKDDNYEFIKNQLENYSPETLLFLKTLKIIDIETTDKEKIIECEVNGSFKSLSHIIGDKFDQKQFWVESKKFDVPKNIDEDKREGVTTTEITIAFPLDGVTGEERIFSYLPTEERPGFPFHINADFLLPSSRESILKNKKWNNWLLDMVGDVVAEGILGQIENLECRYSAYGFIPLPKKISSRGKYKVVCDSVKAILESNECVIDDSDSLVLPSTVIRVPVELRSLLVGVKPKYFDDVNLVNDALSDYSNELDFIGCQASKNTDVIQFFEDEVWIEKHDDDWLIDAYDYLIKIFTRSQPYLKFNMIRSDQGEFTSPSNIYQPIDNLIEEEIERIPLEYRAGIDFVSRELFDKINSKGNESRTRNLKINKFSMYVYLRDLFIPRIQEKYSEFQVKEFKELIDVFIKLSMNLTEDEYEEVASEMPVLLDDDGIVIVGHGDQLVTPSIWNKKTGWQKLFVTDEDREHFFVLNDYYSTLGRKKIKRYFETIEVTGEPGLKEIEIGEYAPKPNVLQDDYFNYISTQFLSNHSIRSTYKKTLSTLVLPLISNASNKINKSSREALIQWLNASLISWPSKAHQVPSFRYSKGEYFFQIPRAERLDSSLFHYLRTMKWVGTSNGLQKPGQVFLPDDTVKRIFGNKLPFLTDDLHPDVIKFLGINDGATEETIVRFLSDMQTSNIVKKSTLIAVYSYLDNHCKDYESSFTENSLIYVPYDKGKWLKSSEVIWADASFVIGEAFGWLDTYYPESLRKFFIKKLRVQESVDDKSLIDAWLRIQEKNEDKDAVENILKLGIPAVLRAVESDEEEWFPEFLSNALVWTQDESWENPSNVYVPDNIRLRKLFEDQLYFVWKPDSLSHGRLEDYYSALDIKELSLEVNYSIETSGSGERSSLNNYLTRDTVKLLGYALFNLDKEGSGYFDNVISNGFLKSLAFCHEIALTDFRVTCTIDSEKAYIDDYSAFWDKDTDTLYFDKNADPEDILDDIEEQIAKYLWGSKYKDYKDSVRKLVRANEKRFKKVRDHSNWHLPKEKLKELDKLFDEPPIQNPCKAKGEDKTTEEQPANQSNDLRNKEDMQSGASDNNTPGQGQGQGRARGASDIDGSSTSKDFGNAQSSEPSQKTCKDIPPPVKPKKSNLSNVEEREGDSADRYNGTGANRAGRTKSFEGKRKKLSLNSNKKIVSPNDRKPVYVGAKKEDDYSEKSEQQACSTEIGDRGENYVLEHSISYLLSKSNKFDKAPTNNEGFDITEIDSNGEIVRYIEVKTLTGEWGEGGVGVTKPQMEFAQAYDNWWLFVVENINTQNTNVHVFKNPFQQANRFMFDGSWKQLAEIPKTNQVVVPKEGDKYTLLDGKYEVISIEAKGKFYKVRLTEIQTGKEVTKKFEPSWEKC